MSTENNTQTITKEAVEAPETARRAAIKAALSVKQTFEMYVYRIISHETFVLRMVEHCATFDNELPDELEPSTESSNE